MAAAVLALAGCAGGGERLSKPEYERTVRSVYARVQAAFRATNVQERSELPARVADAQAALRRGADELGDVRPPKEVEDENEELVEGLREYAEALEPVREAAEQGNERAIEEFNRGIGENEAVEQIAEAAEEMKRKGYDLGPIAEE